MTNTPSQDDRATGPLSYSTACTSDYKISQDGGEPKRVKSGGWQLQRTRITTCARLERLWLAMAVATMWVLEVGGSAEVEEQQGRQKAVGGCKKVGEDTPALPDLEELAAQAEPEAAQKETVSGERPAPQRIWSIFSRGWQLLRNALAVGGILLAGWYPEPWPDHPTAELPPTVQACARNAEGPAGEMSKGSCSMNGSHDNDSG
jgi:hypothetical protein